MNDSAEADTLKNAGIADWLNKGCDERGCLKEVTRLEVTHEGPWVPD